MNKNKQTAVIVGAIIVVLIILSFVASGSKKTATPTAGSETATSAVSETSTSAAQTPEAAVVKEEPKSKSDEKTATPAPAAAAVNVGATAITKKGTYEAECLVPGTGTLIGRVEMKDNQSAEKIKSVEVENMNTKKSTKVDLTTARCTFTPAK